MHLNSYLTFDGNCREAMTFYQECLGGKLTFQTIGESPLSEKMPKQMRESILHATLTKGQFILMASDMVNDIGLIKGNSVSLTLHCNSKEETTSCYAKLSAGGMANHPLKDNFGGALFGNLTDKFDNHWIISFNRNYTI